MDEENLNWPVTVTLFYQEQCDGKWMPDNLADAVAWLQAFLDQVPAEYRHTAKIEIDSVGSYEDSHYANIEISYQRPPTDEEKQARLAKEHQRNDARQAERRQQYECLKTEFGE